ncbi:MAG: hypothetical protein ACRETW_07335 [Stenotrophobium sp.]
MRTLVTLCLLLALPAYGFASAQMVCCQHSEKHAVHRAVHEEHTHHAMVAGADHHVANGLICKDGCRCHGHCSAACMTVLGVASLASTGFKFDAAAAIPGTLAAHATAAHHLDPFRPPILAAT